MHICVMSARPCSCCAAEGQGWRRATIWLMNIAASETAGWGIKCFRWQRFTEQPMPMTKDGGEMLMRL